jgi:hypothetical protein
VLAPDGAPVQAGTVAVERPLWELQAREAIRDTIGAYTHAGDGFRLDDLAACFTEDGVLQMGEEPIAGRAAIVDYLASLRLAPATLPTDRRLYVRHHVSSIRIESVTAEEARAMSYFFVMTPIGPDHWGRYRDRLVPSGGRWLLAHRHVLVDDVAATSLFRAEPR